MSSVNVLGLIERWKQAMCSEHDAKLTMSGQGGWMCMSGGVHIVREPVWIDVVPADQLRGAVARAEALERELGYAIDALEGKPWTGWSTDTARDTLQGGQS